tara:strand:- start:4423 stop:5262 length:840 start_codon:yes stop_codon:yes gene_type:complete
MFRKLSNKENSRHTNNLYKLGYTKVNQFMSSKYKNVLLKKVNEEHKKIKIKTSDYIGAPKRSSKDLLVFNLVGKDKLFVDLVANQNLEKIIRPILNDPFYNKIPNRHPNYIISACTARSSGKKLDLHIDSRIPFKGSQPLGFLVIFVLEKMDSKNGATVLVPKSHLSGKFPNRKTKNIKTIAGEPGDLLIFDTRIWHGTTENQTNSSRWTINAVITQWWIKQQLNISHAIPKKIFSKLTNKQKQLLGFCSIPPNSVQERISVKCGYKFLKNYNQVNMRN